MPRAPEPPARLRAQQMAFAAHLRDPANAPPTPGIEDRRLAIYRDLFFNNVASLLAGNFPVIRKMHDDDAWRRLVRDFYREHRCVTPLFPELGREFIRWLEARRARGAGDPDWLLELAHYEWVELALALDEARLDRIDADPAGDLLDGIPVWSPLAWPLAYRWPVHRIGPSHRPDTAPEMPTFLLVVRDRGDAVRFKEITPATWTLAQRLAENVELSGRELLTAMALEADVDPQAMIRRAAPLLAQLRERDAVLGTRRGAD